MSALACSRRVFPLCLAAWLPGRYGSYLRWLSHLIERLGAARTLALWQTAHQGYEDALLNDILAGGWRADEQADVPTVEERITALLTQFFPMAREGIDQAQARRLVEQMPPIRQIRWAI